MTIMRIPMKRVAGAAQRRRLLVHGNGGRRYSMQDTATASISPAKEFSNSHMPALSNLDPASDSATTALVKEHEPFMIKTYNRPPPVFIRGKGCHMWDLENRQYLDFTAGIAVNSLGHCDPGMISVMTHQAKELIHASNLYYNPWTGSLSELLVQKTLESGGLHDATSVFVCNSGSEANEAALKFARKTGKILSDSGTKTEIVSFNGSFHGRTMGSLSATPNLKYQKPFSPMLPGFRYGTFNDVAAIQSLVTVNTCGVIVEPIQGEGGVNVASEEFLLALAARCRDVGAVLIYDEIQCGLSRTGTFWTHSTLPREAHPDIITTAKALGNGFPIGATIVNRKIAENIVAGDHGTTFGGNPLGCRIAHYIVSRLGEKTLQDGVRRKSELFRKHFLQLQREFPNLVKEVRGKGLILGLQLSQDPSPVVTAARERGLLIITCGVNTIRFVPPLTITEAEINTGMAILHEAIRIATTPGERPVGQQVSGVVDSPN